MFRDRFCSNASVSEPRLFVEPDAAAAARRTAELFVEAADRAVEARGVFRAALSGGATPQAAYRLLSGELADRVRWSCCEFFFGDERCVPFGDRRSNFLAASESLLAPARVRPERVFRMEGELEPEEAARRYEAVLCAAAGGVPVLDLVLLGIGEDGHTASLFPGTAALEERRRWVVPSEAPDEPRRRLTLTLPAINAARAVVFLVCGAAKAGAAALARSGGDVPAARVRPEGGLAWVLDRAAAGR
jgi:6-phosphogluconolactonase